MPNVLDRSTMFRECRQLFPGADPLSAADYDRLQRQWFHLEMGLEDDQDQRADKLARWLDLATILLGGVK